MNKAVFLDRDGVINRKAPEDSYIRSWSEIEILPGVSAAIRRLNKAGYLIIVATNQRGIAKREMTVSQLHTIHRRLIRSLAAKGAGVHAVYCCPHDLDEKCSCRKPNPGMLNRAMGRFDIDPQLSWMVGDNVRDIDAGRNAGCRTVLISSSLNGNDYRPVSTIVAKDLQHAVDLILQFECATTLEQSSGDRSFMSGQPHGK